MFRIKKNDYNTVQFMPEYESSASHDGRRGHWHGSRAGFIAAVVAAIVIIGLIASGIAYFTYFSPAKKFARSFEEGDMKACEKLVDDNAFDESFVAAIKPAVTAAGNEILEQFKADKIKEADAIARIGEYNRITDRLFDDELQNSINAVNASKESLTLISEAEKLCKDDEIKKAYEKVSDAMDLATTYSLNLNDELTDLFTKYSNHFKDYLFRDFATDISVKNYDAVIKKCSMMYGYTNDIDYKIYSDTAGYVKSGDVSSRDAVADAKEIANEAAKKIPGRKVDEEK